ncbi:hypothetical protein MKX78_21380 [Cytobacillus sp. FSL R5-0569]|uniref:hypothetical protein n=1 Tax=Cytobacillus TaxID=2675230 RepID=UPI0027843769|nr:hypothetical protein [Cytobacillus kochii]MDQ0185791.1 hypothetical protein [Cytobacillus kochii]
MSRCVGKSEIPTWATNLAEELRVYGICTQKPPGSVEELRVKVVCTQKWPG